MKSRNPDSAQDDASLFEREMGDVKRLHHKLAPSKQVRAAPLPPSLPSTDIASEFGEELRYIRPGIQTSSLQKLRRGQFPIEATLDLHGLTAAEASARVVLFVQQCQTMGRTAVRIVHGKGYGSTGRQPVLKSKIQELLPELASVLAFCSARPQNGGTGAVDVLLKKSKVIR